MIRVLLIAASLQQTAPAERLPNQETGLCLRWSEDGQTVADAVLMFPSNNPEGDAALMASYRSLASPEPDGYRGQWVPTVVNALHPPSRFPDCSGLPAREQGPAEAGESVG